MSARIYEDCELVIQISGERYLAQLSNIHAGEASGEFALPFTQVELSNFYSRIGQAHRATRGGATPDVEAAKRFGDQLFRSVFAGQMLSQLRASVDHAHEHGHGLRLRLRLKNVPDLGELPWEFLYDREQDHFIATSTMTPMVRYLDLPQSVSTLRVRAPLRVLVVLAGPRNLPLLDAEGEWQRLKATLGPLEAAGALSLERLPDGTLATLRRRARGDPFHILHFVGHGGFDEVAGDGVLHFENTQCLSDPIAGQMLGNILRDHDTLRLVVLNACEGARQSNQNPFSGVAQSLCQQRMPAVIAMQFEISDDAAKTFAEEFYGAIADGLPVDAAVSESRKALYSGRFGQEWATPVLYMRSPSGLLFDIQKRPKQPEAVKPLQPPVDATPQPAQPVQQRSVQQEPVQRPAPPPPPPPRPAFDIDAERRKLDAERARIEAERIEREKLAADAEARRRNEEERLKAERLRFEQEQAQARVAAEAQRRRDEQIRREEQQRRDREDQQRREQEEQARRERLEAQYREQERVRAEEARRKEQLRLQQEREAAAAAAARPAPPPPIGPQPMAFASVVPVVVPQKSHRLRKSIVVTLAVIGAVLLTLLIIGLIVGSSESRVNHMRAGDEAMAARKFDEAITHFKAAVSKHPEMAETHSRLCNAIAFQGENSPGQKGDYAGAVAECEEAVRLNPESAEAHSNLCNALNDNENARLDIKGDYGRAIAECRRAIQLDRNNAEAWNNLCNVVGTRGEQPGARPTDHKEAVEACNEAIRLMPDYAEAHKNLGDLYRDSGDESIDRFQNVSAIQFFNQAAAEYKQAVNVRPDYEIAEAQLGAVLYKNNKAEAAREELDKAIKLDPSDYIAHFWLGNVYFRALKQNGEALTEFKRVVELKPDLAAGEYGLSQVYRAEGDSTEANSHLTNAYNRNPNDKNVAADYKRYIASGSSSLGIAPVDQSVRPAPAADNSLDGWYFGTTRNVTFHKESRAAIYLEHNGRQLRGCLLVYPPLNGSGPLTGSVDSSAILLEEKTANYIITFSGDAAGGRIVGSYVVHWPNLQSEFGNISLTKSSQPILAAINVNACPSDAENRSWAS